MTAGAGMTDKPGINKSPTPSVQLEQLGAVILCGGQSSRMGHPKHELWFNGQTFLEAVAQSIDQVAQFVVAVVGFNEPAPNSLPPHVRLVRDDRPDLGPLEGIRAGLAALEQHTSHAFVTSCDVPLIRASLIQRLGSLCHEHEAVVPVKGERIYGMTAVYRTDLHRRITKMLVEGSSRRVSALRTIANTREVPVDDLQDVDPELDSFTNVNTADQYFALLQRSGLQCPAELAQRLRQT